MKILIIRFSSIGDIVLTTPVVRCLKKQTNAEVHYLTRNAFKSVLEANPYIDKLWSIEKKPSEIIDVLKKEKFDYIIDLHHNLRSMYVKWHLGVRAYSFNKINIEKWLIVNLKINILPKKHVVDRYLETVQVLGVKNDGEGLNHFIPKECGENVTSFFDKIDNKILSKPYIAFVIGAAHATKRVTAEKAISICKRITLPILLIGGPDDRAQGEIIAKNTGEHVFNACGLFKLNESAWLVDKAHKVIAHDTGLMHIAAALHKNIISLWGSTVPELGVLPYYGDGEDRNKTVEVKTLSCRPCTKFGRKACPKGHFRCMNDLNEDAIEKHVKA